MKPTFTGKSSYNKLLLVRLISITFILISFHPFLKVTAQEEEKTFVKPGPEPKYNLGTQLISDPDPSMFFRYHAPKTLVTTCPNSDFSLGDFSNWDGCYGTFSGPNGAGKITFLPCVTPGFSASRHVIMPLGAQVFDPLIGDPLTTVFPGETHSARLGDASGGGHAEQLKYTVNIGADNYLFVYRWASVLESYNHPAAEMPEFTIQVQTLTGDPLGGVCGFYEFVAPSCLPTDPGCVVPPEWIYKNAGTPTSPIHLYWHDWTTIALDLSTLVAFSPVQIVFTTRGCSHTAHRGYAYISTYCSALTIQTALCDNAPNAILTAPPGFASYLWSTTETTPSITITNPQEGAQYWVDVTSNNGCTAHITNVLHYTIVTADFIHVPACLGQPTQFTDQSSTNQNDIVAWDWDFGDLQPIQHEQNPIHTFTAEGIFNVKLTAYSTEGCPNEKIIPVSVAALTTVDPIANQAYCNGDAVVVTPVSSPAGAIATFAWTNSTPSIGLAASGTGDISAFTATNATTAPVTATVSVIPTVGGCPGATQTYTITVNPIARVNDPADQVVCNNAQTSVTFGTTNTGGTTTYSWSNTTTSIGLDAGGTGSIASFTATNTTTAPVVATVTVTPTFTNESVSCDGPSQTFTITVNPSGQVNDPADQVVCNNAPASATFGTLNTGGTTTYTWANTTTSVGLGASGSGNITTFTATNTGTVPVVATITVTPTFTNQLVSCVGTPQTFTITVNPSGQVNDPANQVVCNSSPSSVTFGTTSSGGTTTYDWTNSDPSIGIGASGTGDITAFTAINTGLAPVVATIAVIPTFTNDSKSCTGPSESFTITVNPSGHVIDPANQVICNNALTSVTFGTLNTGGTTTYSWANNTTSIGLGATGTGDITSFTAINTGLAPVIATVTVTPTFTSGSASCDGTPQAFDITVNPSGQVNDPADQVVCNNAMTSASFSTTHTGGTTSYSWTNNTTSIGLGASGTGDIASFTATNTTTSPVIATVTVTPTFTNGSISCDGP
ncbi:MAG: PKD domain-containing protein, partial [Bacteroidetes bacterium]|nr:PKD domain-containing protein [Bacteroidota bacterium]